MRMQCADKMKLNEIKELVHTHTFSWVGWHFTRASRMVEWNKIFVHACMPTNPCFFRWYVCSASIDFVIEHVDLLIQRGPVILATPKTAAANIWIPKYPNECSFFSSFRFIFPNTIFIHFTSLSHACRSLFRSNANMNLHTNEEKNDDL